MSIKPEYMTPIIMFFNFITVFGGLWLLSKYGRKTILFWGNIAMAIFLYLIGLFFLVGFESGTILMILLFICAYNCSSGPVIWLYMSEIMQDKGTGFASSLNWGITIVISTIVPYSIYYLTDGSKYPD